AGQRVVPLTFQPVQYNPAQGILKIARQIRVDVDFAGVDLRNSRTDFNRRVTPSFNDLYKSTIINYEEPDQAEIVPGTYLMICPNDAQVIAELQPLIEWRERKGTPVLFATTSQTGTSTSAIKSYIQGVYNSADPPLEYVCLVGDGTSPYLIATWRESFSGYNGEGDHPYTQLDGSDILPDVHIGRLSFNTLDKLKLIVAKMVNYESNPYLDNTSWYTRACLVGDPYDSGYTTVVVNQWIKTRLVQLGYAQIDTIWDNPFVTQMVEKLNRGDTIFSYRGIYGMSGWSNSYAYSLTNGWMLPFCVNLTCDTGSFASGTAYSEGFLMAGTGNPLAPKGGIGSIGTSTTGTHTRYNNCMHYGIFQGLLYEEQYEMGATLSRGKVEFYLNYNLSQPNTVNTWLHWNNLIGDPAGEVWTGVPQPLTVEYPSTDHLGTNSFAVTVTDHGAPVANALVCFKKGTESYITGYTNTDGEVILPTTITTTGDMLVTVTKHNYQPHLGTVSILDPAMYIGFESVIIDDDTTGDSSGNYDGIANPGETLELRVQLKNHGFVNASGVTAVLTTSDPFVTLIDTNESFGTINGGASAWSLEDFDISIAPGCPQGHIIPCVLDIASGANAWQSLMMIEVTSSELVAEGYTLYNVGGNGILDPGETGQLSVELTNAAGALAINVAGTLVSLSPGITVTDDTGSFGTIAVGNSGENTGDLFEVQANSMVFPGYLANFMVVTEFYPGRHDTSYVNFTVGTRATDDPIGPDQYGYWAFDNTDTYYPEAPIYEWIEIDTGEGGDGTLIYFNDLGQYQDQSKTINIPFPFSYYGTPYTLATVCTNGWIAMGSSYLTNFRNWTIPGAGGPNGMVAVFWDDLFQSGGGEIYQKYDSANHRWIVEWSRMRNLYNGSTETFEVIFYDPAYYSTDTGDGIIVFQYLTIANVDGLNGYATVGIENADHSDGLLYTYWNQYPLGAATLAAGRAIKFLPAAIGPTGTVTGTVRNELNSAPIQNAMVTILENGRSWVTGQEGTYVGGASAGVYTLVAQHESFEPDTSYNVLVEEGGIVTIDFNLTDVGGPVITTTTHPSTDDEIGPYPIPVSIEEYSGLSELTLFYTTNGSDYSTLPVNHQSGDEYLAEIPGQDYTAFIGYYIYGRDGLGNESFDPPGGALDPYSFYVVPVVEFFNDDLESEQGWTVGAPGDNATTGIWIRLDPNGTWAEDMPVQPEDDNTPTPGTRCYITGNGSVGGSQGENDVDDGTTTLFSPVIDLSSAEGMVMLRYYRWYTNNTGSAVDDSWVVKITDNGSDWVELENTSESARYWRLMEFNLNQYIDLTNHVQVQFIASDLNSGSIVEAGVDDMEFVFAGISGTPAPTGTTPVFLLSQNSPNPAAATTTIRFILDREGPAELLIYDVRGRVLRRLIDGPRNAGVQSVLWDGLDGRGRSVPPGIYFYRLKTDRDEATKKMVIMR
ncbi:MAG: carboxypeptidase regulatory-like domain-containing protein, partial [Candidatus Eisenbacteria bacterium]|nr:carboxypeptidase regulatory-like domain-containing protein [Candidatus Eisenbacteria bacterium]